MAVKNTELIEIMPINIVKTDIRIVGTSPLITHAWSEKAKREILDKQMKKTKSSSRNAKNPVDDFIRSLYWLTPMPDEMTEEGFLAAVENGARFGFPVTAFKQAAISAAYRLGWVKDKMSMRGAFFIEANDDQMVQIKGDTPIMREDMVKVGMGVADVRYRGEFRNWYADLTISYNASGKHTLEQIITIINAGGYVCGVGEWRPERDGQYGMFRVETS